MYHDLVFEAAEAIFAEKGFDAATMQDVASEAGVSLNTLYSVFPGKNELYQEIRSTRQQEFEAAMGVPLETIEDPVAALEAGVRAYVDFLVDHPEFLQLHLREGQAWAVRSAEEPSEGLDRFAQVIERGMSAGVFHQGDPQMMALVGIAIIQVWLGRMAEQGDEDRERIANEILEQLRRVYCIGQGGRRAAA
jgi:AcrR family transcriptional regulator